MADSNPLTPHGPERLQRPVADLVRELAEQTTVLARQEARRAQLELAQKGKAAGIGAGMLGAAGVFGLFGLAALLSGAGAVLALVLPVWAAALVISGVALVPADVLMLAGRVSLSHVSPLVPEQTKATVREDVVTIKERARR